MDRYTHQEKIVTHLLDMASAGTIIATLADILPAISAFLACVWMLIRIFETATIKSSIKTIFSDDEEEESPIITPQNNNNNEDR
jgi:hypothetical protein